MYHHIQLGQTAEERRGRFVSLFRSGAITMGGYKKGKIYGSLHCRSGKRMKPENRVFFKNEEAAIAAGYRPCGACMPAAYRQWKAGKDRVEQAGTAQ